MKSSTVICSYIVSIRGYRYKILFVVYFLFLLSIELFKVLEVIIKFIFLLVKLYSKFSIIVNIDIVTSLGFFKTRTNQYQPILVVNNNLPFYK